MSSSSLAILLALDFASITWNLLAGILVLICIILITIILIQDSKGAGLTSAFGAGPGGESLLGARMQKDVARWTIYISIVFGTIVIIMCLLGNYITRYGTAGAAGAKSPPAAESVEQPEGAAPGAEGGASDSGPSGALPEGASQKSEGPEE